MSWRLCAPLLLAVSLSAFAESRVSQGSQTFEYVKQLG